MNLLWFFPCRHSRTSFPQTFRGDRGAHVVCLSCGREFDFNWKTMTRGMERAAHGDIENRRAGERGSDGVRR